MFFLAVIKQDGGVLTGFVCQLDTSWSYHRERSFSWGNASMRFIFQLVIKERGPIVCGAIPGLVTLDSRSESRLSKSGEASQYVSSVYGLCISSHLQDPALFEFLS